MSLAWPTFDEQVRDIGSKVYGTLCEKRRENGVEIDGWVQIAPDYVVAIQCASNPVKSAISPRVKELADLKRRQALLGVYLKAFVVVRGNVGPSTIAEAERDGVVLTSVSGFASLLIEYQTYADNRVKFPFGSAVDPKTGSIDRVSYVPVSYSSADSNHKYTLKELATHIRDGRTVVLLGEFGSGKSRCISQIFTTLSAEWGATLKLPFAINLRECWGMQTAEEVIRRHITSIDSPELEAAAVRVLKRDAGIYLLDGFDEMGSQAWSSDESKLRSLRAQALRGVRAIIANSRQGCLVAGREHYFSSYDEMTTALGLEGKNPLIIRVSEEFTLDEMEEYFERADINVALPRWLPRRPLVCQTIAQLDTDEIGRMFSAESHEAEFWEHFIEVVCRRDARISDSFDAKIILAVYIELARQSRVKPTDVGPFSLRDLQAAFERAVGQAPTEDASVMLQRLPSLGRIGPESTERQFIDGYILDGLRAKDVARIIDDEESARSEVLTQQWINALGVLGQRVLARAIDKRMETFFALAGRAAVRDNGVLTADLVSSLLHTAGADIDFRGLEVHGATFGNLNLSLKTVRNLEICDSVIEEFILPHSPPTGVTIYRCSVGSLAGASNFGGLPFWIKLDSVDEFDSVQNLARIRTAGLSSAHEILVAIVKKTFFQKGTGRKEDALLRGFGNGQSSKVAGRVLNLLMRHNVLTSFKGDEGIVYAPVRSQAGRMNELLSQLVSSEDEIWKTVGEF